MMAAVRLAWRALSGAALLLGAEVAHASEEDRTGAAPLLLQEVLRVLDATHPDLEAAARKQDQAEAKRFGAEGAWDPVLEVEGKTAPAGYYQNGEVTTNLRQATPLWGLGLYAGYRVGWGDFPVYKGDRETLSGGELRAGMKLPLWKDRAIDARRAGIQQTEALTDVARCAVEVTRLKVRRDAAHAYWGWVAAGQTLAIQADLLEVAKARDAGLRRRVELGSAPPILAVDNARLVLERESKWLSAQRDFQRASLQLSLFLRDPQRSPVVVSGERVPTAIAEPDRALADGDVEQALRLRPEVCYLGGAWSAATVDLALADNERAPSLDAHAFVARDMGTGPDTLSPTEVGVGIRFEMPLALRKARGEQRAAYAQVEVLDAQRRGLRDRIAAEVAQARVDLDTAHRQLVVARQQLAAARQLAEAERTRFAQGVSDLVIVNLREIAAAEAARAEVEALVALQRAHVDYLTATGVGV